MREKIGDFQICSFDALTTHELYEMMRARADVFVGEEKILYPDADGVDYDCIHVFRTDSDGRVIAYLRMFRKADEPGTIQMGRVLTREHGQGLGHKLLEAAMQGAAQFMGAREVYLESGVPGGRDTTYSDAAKSCQEGLIRVLQVLGGSGSG